MGKKLSMSEKSSADLDLDQLKKTAEAVNKLILDEDSAISGKTKKDYITELIEVCDIIGEDDNLPPWVLKNIKSIGGKLDWIEDEDEEVEPKGEQKKSKKSPKKQKEEEAEVEAKQDKPGKPAKKASGAEKNLAKPDKKKSEKPKGPGVIASIASYVTKAGKKKGISKEEILEKLTAQFPDRMPEAMKKTINVQLPKRMAKEKGLDIQVTKDGNFFVK